MFAGAGAVRGDRAAHQVVVDRFGLFPFLRILGIQQQQPVEVAGADVADDGVREACTVQFLDGVAHAVGQPRDRHANVRGAGAAAGPQ
ncbi:hypothetical protein G6F57_020347 [Rhizopus arrhizus]|nr:hypothetical protein G6F57_020347 [Rhizopus arrhizus]